MKKSNAGYVKPFLKWPGSKASVLDQVLSALPSCERLVEPFVGSGAVALNAKAQRVLACDVNPVLIDLYRMVQADPHGVVASLKERFAVGTGREAFLETRNSFNASTDRRERAVMFAYLSRLAFNGLVRFNSSGSFNSPPGAYVNPYLPEREIVEFAERSQHVEFRCCDFRVALSEIREGDAVYMDPPYLPSGKADTHDGKAPMFTGYASGGFRIKDHWDMVQAAIRAAERGIPVAISNSDSIATRQLYAGARLLPVLATRRIAASKESRGAENELIAVYDEHFSPCNDLQLLAVG